MRGWGKWAEDCRSWGMGHLLLLMVLEKARELPGRPPALGPPTDQALTIMMMMTVNSKC